MVNLLLASIVGLGIVALALGLGYVIESGLNRVFGWERP